MATATVVCAKCGRPREAYLNYCRSCGDRSAGIASSNIPPIVPERPPTPPPAAPAYLRAREEDALLWRSIVQGFGFALGATLFLFIFWIVVFVLLGALLHTATPTTPTLPGLPLTP